MKVVGVHGKLGSGKSTVCRALRCVLASKGIASVTYSIATPLKTLCSEVFDYPAELNHEQGGKAVRLPWAAIPCTQTLVVPQITAEDWQAVEGGLSGPVTLVPALDIKRCLPAINTTVAARLDYGHRILHSPVTVGKILQVVGQAFRDVVHPDFWLGICIAEILAESKPGRVVLVDDIRYQNEAEAFKAWGWQLINVERDFFMVDGRDPKHISESDLDGYGGWDHVITNAGTEADLAEQIISLKI